MNFSFALLLALAPQSGGEEWNRIPEPSSTAVNALRQTATPTRNSSAMGGRGFYGGGLNRRGLQPAQRRGTGASGPSFVAVNGAARAAAGRLPTGADGAVGLEGDVAAALAGLLAGGQQAPAPGPTPAAGASKWDLIGKPAAPRVPSALLERLTAGPLTDAEAQALVELITHATPARLAATDEDPALARLRATTPDPDLQTLQVDLDALVPPGEDGAPHPVDGEVLRTWFKALDVSRDAAISFLEWRDRTSLPLHLFRRVDTSGEGLVSFDEFSQAMLLNVARTGGRPVDPELLKWALGVEAAAQGEASTAGDVETMSQDELMRRARDELTSASQLLRAESAANARAAAAAARDPNAANDPKAGARAGAPALPPPGLKPTPIRVLFQRSTAPKSTAPQSAIERMRERRARQRG
jgi:hypothetical protein